MKHLTIRDVPEDLSRALETEKRRRGQSLNQTVKDLLKQALGLGPDVEYDNGLGRLSGTWSEDELRDFETATAFLEETDEEVWR